MSDKSQHTPDIIQQLRSVGGLLAGVVHLDGTDAGRIAAIAVKAIDEIKHLRSEINGYEALASGSPTLAEARQSGVAAERAVRLALVERLTEQRDALVTALRPFVNRASHTKVFLQTREKMHPTGVELYDEDVERARAALKGEDDDQE